MTRVRYVGREEGCISTHAVLNADARPAQRRGGSGGAGGGGQPAPSSRLVGTLRVPNTGATHAIVGHPSAPVAYVLCSAAWRVLVVQLSADAAPILLQNLELEPAGGGKEGGKEGGKGGGKAGGKAGGKGGGKEGGKERGKERGKEGGCGVQQATGCLAISAGGERLYAALSNGELLVRGRPHF